MYFSIRPSSEDPRIGIIAKVEVHPQALPIRQLNPEINLSRYKNHAELIEIVDECARNGFHKAREISLAREVVEWLRDPTSSTSVPILNR